MADKTISSYDAYHGYYQGRYLYVDFNQTRDTASNSSTISWKLYSTGGEDSQYTVGPTYVYINGGDAVYYKAQVSGRWTGSPAPFPATKGSVSGTKVVKHGDDGTKTITVSLTTAVYYDGTGTTSASWTLRKIDRNSTIVSVPAFNIEGAISCTVDKHLDTYTDVLTISYGGETITTVNNYISGTTFTLTNEEIIKAYKVLGSAKSGDFTFEITTYNGASPIGTSQKTALGTCVGNGWVNVNGVWRRALYWINDNGTWRKALAFTKDGATWKRGT